MKTILFVIYLGLLTNLSMFANDGAYFATGNQLIPITETEISITKEILTIIRKDDGYIYVTVDYTFYNPTFDKTILVGFEAPSPSGDVDGYPINGKHPYIKGFSVKMNDVLLQHKVAIVNEENYYIEGKINSKKVNEVIGDDFNANEPDFYYVYYFDANFKKGINKIIHTYRFKTSGSVMENYYFDYILTAATRWANHKIDDFTLNITMGNDESFELANSFFSKNDKWTIDDGRSVSAKLQFDNKPTTKFITFSGGISFSMKNFIPKGELHITSPRDFNVAVFNFKEHNLPGEIKFNTKYPTVTNSKDEKSYKILRNLPFALRGYVFKTAYIQTYYLSQKWYKPNLNYKPSLKNIAHKEKEWFDAVNKNKWDKAKKE